MELNQQILDNLFQRIKNGQMTVAQAPEPYQSVLQAKINETAQSD